VLLAVKTAAEWLKFRSRIDFHARSPPNQEYTNISSIYFIIPNVRSLIKSKISPEPPHFFPIFFLFFSSLFFGILALAPIPCPERKE
ncbi:hypothetical protein P4H94_16925, partial [Paenibacillus macerans]|uniref:hypothetical protein n=1 Tax=Paenibacillus macerans TaxID=44252 RepID=UPI002DBDED1C